MSADRALSAFRLARHALWHRRGQTLLIIVISLLVSATVVFAAGYQRQVQQAVVDAAFAPNGPGNAWMLTGSADADLAEVLPAGSQQWFDPPVAGRVAPATWTTPDYPRGIAGVLSWRDDSCEHLVIESGRCPVAQNEVAVSDADAERYGARVGQQVRRLSSISEPVAITIVAIYRPRDPAEGYWFGNPPIGSSGFDARDQPRSNPLFTVRDLGSDLVLPQQTLDLRLDRSAATLDHLGQIRDATSNLIADAPRQEVRVNTSIPTTLDQITAERVRAVSGLTLTLVQLAVLVVVVVALLAGVALAAQRGELGLGRLRGESASGLGRQVMGRWAAAIAIGWLIGWLPALGALAYVATRLPGDRGFPAGLALLIAPLVILVLMIAGIVPATRTLLRQPVIDLLRSAPTVVREAGARAMVIDVVVVVVTLSGLLVAIQSGASSILGLLAPSLLAVAGGVVVARLAVWGADRRRGGSRGEPRGGSRGDAGPGGLLTAILLLRLRGLRLPVVMLCLASAFVVFAVQVQAIGSSVRRHEAEVRTGASAVLTVAGEPADLIRAIDELDPGRATGQPETTAVVVTRRADAGATRGMFVEPAAFVRIAYGAALTADEATWSAVAAPTVEPVDFRADAVTLSVGAHRQLGATEVDTGRDGTHAQLGIVYLTDDGSRHSLALGRVRLGPDNGQTLRRPIDCGAGCRLLQLTVAPDGPMRGALPVTGLGAERSGVAEAVALGPAANWNPVPTGSADTVIAVRPGRSGLVLVITSGGLPVAVQQAAVPTVLPVLTAADVRPQVDPVVAGIDGTQLPVESVGVAADAVPRELGGVEVGDLASVLRTGPGSTVPETSLQVWLSPAAAARLPQIQQGLQDRGLPVISTDTLPQALAAQRLTASALTGDVVPALAVLALVFGALGVTLTAAGHRRVLAQDLAALRLAGLGTATLRSSVLRTYLVPGSVAVLLGVAAGAAGCVLVIGGLPLLPDASPAIHSDLSLRSAPLVVCLLLCLVVLLGACTGSALGIARSSRIDQLRGRR